VSVNLRNGDRIIQTMKITVVGTGYVGLVTGTCFAETGNTVTCVDIDKTKIERMRVGHVPIYEPGLEELFHSNISKKRLSFTTNLGLAVKDAEVIFLALPTPPNEDGSADLSYILGVANDLGKLLDHYTIIIDKSTVPVGTAEKVQGAIDKNVKVAVDVVSNPEFLREGFAVEDFLKPDRVVIGTSSEKARKKLKELYTPFVEDDMLYFMDERSAEMTKYAANAFLATKITFMNEIANLCNLTGADVDAVRVGVGSDDRIGKRFLFPGIGYGGSCFPKDVRALQKTAADHEYDFKILESVTNVNESQKRVLFQRIKSHYEGDLKGKKFALWGLAFKPDTDDIREAPALYLIDDLLDAGAVIAAYDPEASENVGKRYKDRVGLGLVEQLEALDGADALLIATEWPIFRETDLSLVKKTLKEPVIFDGRNLYEPEKMRALGFYYESIGRQTVQR
jgi:UDPglucose 6-dehydrogenase